MTQKFRHHFEFTPHCLNLYSFMLYFGPFVYAAEVCVLWMGMRVLVYGKGGKNCAQQR